MSSKVYLLCGVPGSGKTWVAKQVAHRFAWVPQDEYMHNLVPAVLKVAKASEKPVLTECPFAEREVKLEMENEGLQVIPVFIVEEPDVVKTRYEAREQKEIPKSFYSRASSIRARAQDWQALHGKSSEILQVLSEMQL